MDHNHDAKYCPTNTTPLWDGRYFMHHHHHLYPLLGIRSGHHLPTHGIPERYVHGWLIRVLPKVKDPNNRNPHRVQACCPHCGDWFSTGRMFFHIPACVRAATSAELEQSDPPPGVGV